MSGHDPLEDAIRAALNAEAANVPGVNHDRPATGRPARPRRRRPRRIALATVGLAAATALAVTLTSTSSPSHTTLRVAPATTPTTRTTTVTRRPNPIARCARLGALTATTLAIAGCASSHHTTSPPATPATTAPASTTTITAPPDNPPVTPRSTTTTAAPTTTTAAAPTTTAPPSAAAAACSSRTLRFVFDRTTGAAGTELIVLSARDAGSAPCRLDGYFGISLYSAEDHLLTGTDDRKATDPSGVPEAPKVVTLDPGQEATFATSFGDDAPTGSGVACTKVAAAHLIPPNQTTSGILAIPADSQPDFCQPTASAIDVFVTVAGPPTANY